MIYVVLRNGKTLRYNNGVQYTWRPERLEIDGVDAGDNIATIATDLVERVEFQPPCRVMREQRKDKLPLRR